MLFGKLGCDVTAIFDFMDQLKASFTINVEMNICGNKYIWKQINVKMNNKCFLFIPKK